MSRETRACFKTTSCRRERSVQGWCSVRRLQPPALAAWHFDCHGPLEETRSGSQHLPGRPQGRVLVYSPPALLSVSFPLFSTIFYLFSASSLLSLHSGLECTCNWTKQWKCTTPRSTPLTSQVMLNTKCCWFSIILINSVLVVFSRISFI